MRTVTLWPGGGETLLAGAPRILQAVGARLQPENPADSGPALRDSIRKSRAALRGSPSPPPDPALIRELDLGIRLWPVHSPDGDEVDFVIVSGTPELFPTDGDPERVRETCGRIAHAAFAYAAMNARRTVTIAAEGDAVFRSVALDAAKDYPALLVEEGDAEAPSDDRRVVVCPPARADARVRAASARVGGGSRIASVLKGDTLAVFEPREDGDPPVGYFLAIGLLLEHLNEHQAADQLDRALRIALEDRSTGSLTDAVLSAL